MVSNLGKEKRKLSLAPVTELFKERLSVGLLAFFMAREIQVVVLSFVLREDDPVACHASASGPILETSHYQSIGQGVDPRPWLIAVFLGDIGYQSVQVSVPASVQSPPNSNVPRDLSGVSKMLVPERRKRWMAKWGLLLGFRIWSAAFKVVQFVKD